jgi:hypothetical protein
MAGSRQGRDHLSGFIERHPQRGGFLPVTS